MIEFQFVQAKHEIPDNYLLNVLQSISTETSASVTPGFISNTQLSAEFQNTTLNNHATLSLDIETFSAVKHLSVTIEYPQTEYFNEIASALKEIVKDQLRKDWKECIWISDDQSETYANEIYKSMYNTENKLRTFINRLMISAKGVSWWDSYVSNILKQQHQEREKDYRIIAPLFRNVDTGLLSLNTGHLTDIMEYKKRSWNPAHTKDIENLILHGKVDDLQSLQGKLRNQLVEDVDLWKTLFSDYFSDAFLVNWKTFSIYRNHIAHNKLLDKNAYDTMMTLIQEVNLAISEAYQTFRGHHISDEQIEALEAMAEAQETEHLIYIKETDSGVNFYSDMAIETKLSEGLIDLAYEIESELAEYEDLDVDIPTFSYGEEQELLTVTQPGNAKKIILKVEYSIDSGEGSSSEAVTTLQLVVDGNVNESERYISTFTNALTAYNEDSLLHEPVSDAHFDEFDTEELKKDLMDMVFANFQLED